MIDPITYCPFCQLETDRKTHRLIGHQLCERHREEFARNILGTLKDLEPASKEQAIEQIEALLNPQTKRRMTTVGKMIVGVFIAAVVLTAWVVFIIKIAH